MNLKKCSIVFLSLVLVFLDKSIFAAADRLPLSPSHKLTVKDFFPSQVKPEKREESVGKDGGDLCHDLKRLRADVDALWRIRMVDLVNFANMKRTVDSQEKKIVEQENGLVSLQAKFIRLRLRLGEDYPTTEFSDLADSDSEDSKDSKVLDRLTGPLFQQQRFPLSVVVDQSDEEAFPIRPLDVVKSDEEGFSISPSDLFDQKDDEALLRGLYKGHPLVRS